MGDALGFVDLGPGRRALAIAAGRSHNCAFFDDGAVKYWRGNRWGQLGLGDTEARRDEPGELGAALPSVEPW